jgi:hypothetical protein
MVTIKRHTVRPISSHIAATSQAPAGNATLYVTTSGRFFPLGTKALGRDQIDYELERLGPQDHDHRRYANARELLEDGAPQGGP